MSFIEEVKTTKPILKEVATRVVQQFSTVFDYSYKLSESRIKEMKKDSDIFSAWESRVNAAKSREWNIFSKQDAEYAKEIEDRLGNINMSNIIEYILSARLDRKSFLEIMWNEDSTIQNIIKQPHTWFSRDAVKGWYYIPELGGKEIYLSDIPNKIIVAANNADKEHLLGQSLLEVLLKPYERKKRADGSLNSFIDKFGQVIMWYVYDDSMTDAEVKEQTDSLRNAKQMEVIALPPGAGELDKGFGFINPSDLKPVAQMELLQMCSDEISQVILGGTLTRGQGNGTGSYALGAVHANVREDIIESDIKFVRDTLQQLIEFDASLFGYNAKHFYFKFEKERDLIQEAALKKSQEEGKKLVAEKIQTLKSAGYKMKLEQVAEELGVPVEMLEEVETQMAIPQFSSEFESKKKRVQAKIDLDRKQLELFEKYIENNKEKINELLNKSVLSSILSIKKFDDLKSFSVVYPEEFFNTFLLSNLEGREAILKLKDAVKEFSEFEEIDPFSLKFDDAIQYFMQKNPLLYEDLDSITDEAKSKYFYIKKSTDLELTKKLMTSLQDNLDNGGNFKSWLSNIKSDVQDKEGFYPSYLENVYRTNMMSSYAAGRWVEQQEQKANFPYLLYDGIMDGRERDHVHELDGKIFKIDDPIVSKIYPPNGYNCRCRMIQMSEEDVLDTGPSAEKVGINSLITKKVDMEKVNLGSFEGNPAMNWEKTMKGLVKQKEKAVGVLSDKIDEIIKDNNKIKPNLDILDKQLPEEYINTIKGIIENAPQDCINVWNKYSDKIKIETYEYKGTQHYSHATNSVYLNIEKDKIAINGENTTIFHELGHLFDANAGKISKTYNNGEFDEVIIKEATDHIINKGKELKIKNEKVTRTEVYDAISKELYALPHKSRADVSDIFDGATNGKAHGGWTHTRSDKKYWKTHNVSSEAFAEMYSASVNNPDSLEQIKKYFPKSYEVFKSILKEMAKDGTKE